MLLLMLLRLSMYSCRVVSWECSCLTALHCNYINGDEIKLIDRRGREHNATIIFSKFDELKVNIAVVDL